MVPKLLKLTDLLSFFPRPRSRLPFYVYFCSMLRGRCFLTISLVFACVEVFAQASFGNKAIDAAQMYDDGDYIGVIEALEGATGGDNDAAYYYLGLSYLRLRDIDRAEACLKRAVALDPSNYWYRYRLARLYSLTGDSDLTIAMYEELLEDFPKKSDLYYELVNLYLYSQQADKALSTISEIENITGKTDATVMARHSILSQQGKNEEAHALLLEFNKEYSSPQILAMLGDYEMGMYEDSTALAYYDEALSLDESYAPAKLGKAETLRIKRRYPEFFSVIGELMSDEEVMPTAKADYLEALIRNGDPRFFRNHREEMDSLIEGTLRIHPSDTSVIQTAGLYYYATGRTDEAVSIFKSGTERNPLYFSSWADYVSILAEVGDWVTMEETCLTAFDIFPDRPEFLDMAISAQYYQDKWPEVISSCLQLIEIHAGDSEAEATYLTTIGDACYTLGLSSTAYKYYEKALKAVPNHNAALNNYAYFLSLEGKNLKKAYKMSKITVETEPDNATYLDTFGWILHLMGRDKDAKPYFKHAMLYGGKDSATVLEHYSVVLEALGETDLARVYANQARNKAAEEGSEE